MRRPHDNRALPPPLRLRAELEELQVACSRLAEAYEEAYEVALASGGGGMVSTGGGGFGRGEERDPTGETAVVSWNPRHVRFACRSVAASVRVAANVIYNADQRMFDAFLDTDPDLKADRLAKRRAALAE